MPLTFAAGIFRPLHSTTRREPCPTRRHLARRNTMRLAPRKPVQVTCVRGLLWITQTGWPHDILLRPGQNWVSQGRGSLVLEAMEESVLCHEEL